MSKMEYQFTIVLYVQVRISNKNQVCKVQLNAITAEEKEKVTAYALFHTELNHREMAYRMMDED